MTLLAVLVGGALVMLVVWDITLTLFHPTARGPLSYVANRATWSTARFTSLRLLGGRGLSYAGAIAVVVNLLAWVLTLWVGYALVYLPFIRSFTYDPPDQGGTGLVEALYLSGATLTTVGFGDIVATNDLLRFVTLTEAASGFAVLSAGTAFVLSVYPLISQIRSTGLQLADAGALELEGAARLVREGGTAELAPIVRELTENHEHLRRFPVLYYFESGNREESLSAVVRASSLVLIVLRRGPADAGHLPLYADVLENILRRLLGDLERDFVGGRRTGGAAPAMTPEEVERDLEALCEPLEGAGAPREADDLAELLARADAVLVAVAREHGHGAKHLFER